MVLELTCPARSLPLQLYNGTLQLEWNRDLQHRRRPVESGESMSQTDEKKEKTRPVADARALIGPLPSSPSHPPAFASAFPPRLPPTCSLQNSRAYLLAGIACESSASDEVGEEGEARWRLQGPGVVTGAASLPHHWSPDRPGQLFAFRPSSNATSTFGRTLADFPALPLCLLRSLLDLGIFLFG